MMSVMSVDDPAQDSEHDEQRDDAAADQDPAAPRHVASEHRPRDRRPAAVPVAVILAIAAAAPGGATGLVDGRDVALDRTALAPRVLLGLAALELLEQLVEPARHQGISYVSRISPLIATAWMCVSVPSAA